MPKFPLIALGLVVWAHAGAALAAEPATGAYRPVTVGTKMDYGGWTCEVVSDNGLETVCGNGPGRARTYGKFIHFGDMDPEQRGGEISYVICSDDNIVAHSRTGDMAFQIAELSLDNQSRRAIEAFWPLQVGKRASVRRTHGFAGSERIETELTVLGTEQMERGGRLRTVFRVREVSTYFYCQIKVGDAAGFERIWWYDPEDGLIVRHRTKWTEGPWTSFGWEYKLVGVTPPGGPPTPEAAPPPVVAASEPPPAEKAPRSVERAPPAAVAVAVKPPRPVPAAPSAPEPPRRAPRAERPALADTSAIELSFWETVKDSDNPEAFKVYLDQFPDGRFAALARLMMRARASRGSGSSNPTDRPEQASLKAQFADVHFGRYFALVIGDNRYKHLARLQTAATDARVIADLLRLEYGFETKVMLNATRDDVTRELARYRARLSFDYNLLIYYADHGTLDNLTGRGYWLPVDAEEDVPTDWISTSDVTAMVQAIRANHVMVVADWCYSGALLRASSAQLPTSVERATWIKRMLTKRSRTALTSGGLEPVEDSAGGRHSAFAKALIRGSRDNPGVMEGERLFNKIKRPVALNADQTPRYGDIRRAGHDGGDFIFVRR